jgi:hypothetical protein
MSFVASLAGFSYHVPRASEKSYLPKKKKIKKKKAF